MSGLGGVIITCRRSGVGKIPAQVTAYTEPLRPVLTHEEQRGKANKQAKSRKAARAAKKARR